MLFKKTFAFLFVFIMGSSAAHAEFHRWKISELFSNADGTIQFIELFETRGDNDENLLFTEGKNITSSNGVTNTLIFPADLPSNLTANKFFLIATSGFAAVAGITPDYIMSDSFLFIGGGTVNYAGSTSIVNHAALPINGMTSLHINTSTDEFSQGTNSPTNFAGDVGSVMAPAVIPVPAAVWLFASGLIGLVGFARRRGRHQ
jgi:hypothetical protein